MNTIPYLYVNLFALSAYVVMLTAFLAAKKTPEIRSFMLMLFGFICWTGGSVLMRLGVWPGLNFWFYVSIIALFAEGLLIYLFVCTFTKQKGYLLKIIWTVGTVAMLVLTGMGVFLQPPEMTILADGSKVFSYTMGWLIVIPLAFLMLIVLSIVRIFVTTIREKGLRAPGLIPIILGCVAVALGNMIQIIPGNVFPWDTLSGIVFALMLLWSLYRKRMFRLTLLISRSVLILISSAISAVASISYIGSIKSALMTYFPMGDTAATTIVVLLFAAFLAIVYFIFKKIIDVLFTREEHQGRLLKDFSAEITQLLSTEEIMAKMTAIIISELSADQVYICLPENGRFVLRHTSNALADASFSIDRRSPCVEELSEQGQMFLMDEFRTSPRYKAMWDEEKALFNRLDISCLAALKSGRDIIGLVLVSRKDRNGSLNYLETDFLSTVCSFASVAMKNAGLYEQMYREARIDSLTEVYNYRCFIDRINAAFEASKGDNLGLLYVNLDDFKLFNQLYGSVVGDRVLKSTAEILTRCVASSGEVFRVSGKVFALILPGYDTYRAQKLADDVRRRINELHSPDRQSNLTASCGICVSPFSAGSAKELMDNANTAVYNAKTAGKNQTFIYRVSAPHPLSIAEQAQNIVDRAYASKNSFYRENSVSINALTAAIDAKDHYTYNHSRNVACYSVILGVAAGMDEGQIGILHEAALLHDIGKISIPETVLNKPGGLSDEEYGIIKSHVNNSIDMIRHLPSMDYLIPAVIGHHERWDGKGYPRGISGTDLPLAARCLAIADSFDAMTTDRPYRKGLPVSYARDQILKGAGTQFDPELAKLFAQLLDNGEIKLVVRT